MRIKQLNYDDNEKPQTVLAELTVQELAFIHIVTGRMNHIEGNAVMPDGGQIGSNLYDAAASVFVRHWESGVDGYLSGETE